MKSAAAIATIAVFATAALAPSSVHAQTTTTTEPVVVAKDCTQEQRQNVNKLLEQDVNPFKACAMKAKVDIVTISTSRLCPLTECKRWLAYMAANAPDCVYDDTNYGEEFKLKSKDCGNAATDTGASVGDDADAGDKTKKPETKSTDGSDADVKTLKPATKAPVDAGSSSSSSSDMDDANTIQTPKPKADNSTIIEPAPTPKPTTKAPVTPPPSSATSLRVASALCAVSLAVAAFVF